MNAFLRHIDILSKAYENERENLAQESMGHWPSVDVQSAPKGFLNSKFSFSCRRNMYDCIVCLG